MDGILPSCQVRSSELCHLDQLDQFSLDFVLLKIYFFLWLLLVVAVLVVVVEKEERWTIGRQTNREKPKSRKYQKKTTRTVANVWEKGWWHLLLTIRKKERRKKRSRKKKTNHRCTVLCVCVQYVSIYSLFYNQKRTRPSINRMPRWESETISLCLSLSLPLFVSLSVSLSVSLFSLFQFLLLAVRVAHKSSFCLVPTENLSSSQTSIYGTQHFLPRFFFLNLLPSFSVVLLFVF